MNPAPDTELLARGHDALVNRLGPLDAERFVVMLNREARDYTEWHRAQPDYPGSIHDLAARIESFAADSRP